MRKFIASCNTLGIKGENITRDIVRNAYRKLASKFHPDKNIGKENTVVEVMKAVNAAYQYLSVDFDWTNQNLNVADSDNDFWAEQLFEIIEQLRVLPLLKLEVCGSWLWIGGETKAAKDKLKELGCKYAPRKKMWYFAPKGGFSRRPYGYKTWSIDEIRATHGSSTVSKRERTQVEAR